MAKKLLAPFDYQRPDRVVRGFLYPNVDSSPINGFVEVDRGREWVAGLVVYVGKEIRAADLFARISDSGKKVQSGHLLLEQLEEYLRQISQFKIGDVLGVRPSESGFELIKLEKPPRTRNQLP